MRCGGGLLWVPEAAAFPRAADCVTARGPRGSVRVRPIVSPGGGPAATPASPEEANVSYAHVASNELPLRRAFARVGEAMDDWCAQAKLIA